MLAVITGDIINSRAKETKEWQPIVRETLSQYGKNPSQWEIFRGDSFQLQLQTAEAFIASIHIKAAVKQLSELDVRIAIGIGEVDYQSKKITESTGTAFIHSGTCFDNLKKQNLAIKSGNNSFDETLNIMFSLGLLTYNNWTEAVSTAITKSIENPSKNQVELAEILEKSQSSISEALKRGGYEEVTQLDQYYRKLIDNL